MKTWHRLVILGVLAITVGALFQRAAVTGIAFYRMFGTIGIAVMGLWAAYSLARWQVESARSELHHRLQTLRGVVRHAPPSRWKGRDPQAESVLQAEDGTVYIVASTEVPNFRGKRHARRLSACAARLQAWVRELRTGVASIDTLPSFRRVVGLLVLLRREVGAEEDATVEAYGIVAVNAEQLHPNLFLAGKSNDGDGE